MKNKHNQSAIIGYTVALVGLLTILYSILFAEDFGLLEKIDERNVLFVYIVLLGITSVTCILASISVLSRINPKKYILISYSAADAEMAHSVSNCLESAFSKLSKYRFEMLTHDTIPFGADFIKATQQQIEKATIILVIVTKEYVNSEWCKNEFMHLLNAGKHIIPIVVESYSYLSMLPVDYSNVKALMLRNYFHNNIDADDAQQLIKLAQELIKNRRD